MQIKMQIYIDEKEYDIFCDQVDVQKIKLFMDTTNNKLREIKMLQPNIGKSKLFIALIFDLMSKINELEIDLQNKENSNGILKKNQKNEPKEIDDYLDSNTKNYNCNDEGSKFMSKTTENAIKNNKIKKILFNSIEEEILMMIKKLEEIDDMLIDD